MAYDLATVTNSGNQLLASVVSDRSSLVIDKIEVSNTQLASSTDLKSMTSISNVVQTLSANGYQKKDNSFIISTVLDNSGVTADYKAWVFGIWAHEADGGSPILMSVITSTSSPDTISKGSGTPIDYNYKFITTFSNTSSLTIQMASDTYATNDTVIHNSGDETATGTKTFQEIKISNDKFPSLVQTDGQYITLDGGNSEMLPVTDNKNGTEQLNGVQVQPFNKLSDTIGGRNYLINTQNPSATNPVKFVGVTVPSTSGTVTFSDGFTKLTSTVSSTEGETYYRFAAPVSTLMPLPAGTYTLVVDLTSSDNVYVMPRGQYSTDGTTWNGSMEAPFWALSSTEKQFSYTFTIPSNATGLYISLEMYADTNATPDNTGKSFQFRNASIQKGNVATDSSPAPEDKVNVSDMRKPASDVAGIEEVNAKQDKIGYTPADDSKVVHDNHNNTVTANNVTYDLSKSGLKPLGYCGSGSFNDLPLGTVMTNAPEMTDGPNSVNAFTVTTFYFNRWGGRKAQIAIGDNVNLMYFRTYTGASWNSWVLLSDDSKVAHLSGANNFDTVPTINNNPLLLASSLPPDLARTGSDQEFTGKNTFDTAPIDKTTGNPYITKDGVPAVPSTLADTTKPANFQAGLQSGGVSVATSDDLKSVEESAWRVITSSNGNLVSITFLYKINSEGDYLDFMYTAVANSNPPSSTTIIADLSSVISGISKLDGCWINIGKKIEGTLSYSGTQIIINSSNFNSNNGDVVIGTGNKGTTGGANYETGRLYYTSLVNK